MEILYFALGLGTGFVLAIIVGGVLARSKGDQLIHRLQYKTWTLPCPNCRDENDKPTGEIKPESEVLRRMAAGATESGELPSFTCSTCDGTKVVKYEFPRSKPPTISERQIIISPLPGQKKRRRYT